LVGSDDTCNIGDRERENERGKGREGKGERERGKGREEKGEKERGEARLLILSL
jgi:hypothetical protein